MFILISGYFLVSSQKVKPIKVLRIVSELVFYTVLISALASISGLQDFSVISILRTSGFHKTSGFNWWFVRTYIVLYLIHPYLNMFLSRLSQGEYKQFLKAVFILWGLIPMLTRFPFAGSMLVDFVCVYSVGAYLRLWGEKLSGGKIFILYGILFALAEWLLLLLLDIAGLRYAVFADIEIHICGMMMPLTFLSARHLNILQLGDDVATGLGLRVHLTRTLLTATAALLAASAVCVAGLLGFVGLIIPHTARLLIGSDYRFLLPATAFLGAAVVIFSDTFARIIFAPIELPVGILMAILGAPFFLYLSI